MLSYLTPGITYAFAAAVQPGPFQAYLISLTLVTGWRRTLPAVFAPLLSDIPNSHWATGAVRIVGRRRGEAACRNKARRDGA
jgi:threonine/homoserine/homoserine lactone efflux protein